MKLLCKKMDAFFLPQIVVLGSTPTTVFRFCT